MSKSNYVDVLMTTRLPRYACKACSQAFSLIPVPPGGVPIIVVSMAGVLFCPLCGQLLQAPLDTPEPVTPQEHPRENELGD